MILKRTYVQDKSGKAPDSPIPINDEVGRGLLIQFKTLQGTMACQLIPHWIFCCPGVLKLYGGRMKVNMEAINEPALMKLMDELEPKPVAKLLPSDIRGSTVPVFVDLSESELGSVQNTSDDRKTALHATVSTIGDIRGFGFPDPEFTSAKFHRVLRHRDTYSHYEPKPIKWIADRDLDIAELTREQREKGFQFHSPVEDGGLYIISTHMTVPRRTHREDESDLEDGPASASPDTATLEQLKLEKSRFEGKLSTITEEARTSKFAYVDALESALAAEGMLKAREDNEVPVTDQFREEVSKLRREADMRERAKDEFEDSKALLEQKLKDVVKNIDELQRKTAEGEKDDAKRARMSSDPSDGDDFLDSLTKEDRDYYTATRDFPIAGVLMSTAQANVIKARV
ncbi:hypothetical protein DL770_004548 [Monosporascus sp. CRB-9-2]|nr:hypothetical protein DL770_004548 [Monosporascus sp. CRB-9-2]